jgi:site-specific DNA-cytosine methylase
LVGFDVDKTCKYPYERNNSAKFKERDVSILNGYEIRNLCPENSIMILAGCAPCQPFGGHDPDDTADPHSVYSREVRSEMEDLRTLIDGIKAEIQEGKSEEEIPPYLRNQ